MPAPTITQLLGIYNVRDFGFVYGASIDNAAAINAAIAAARAAGGGQVWLPPDGGTVAIGSSVELYDDVELVIPTGVTLKLIAGANVDLITAAVGASARIRISGGGTIDGNRANNTSGTWHGIDLSSISDVVIERVVVTGCRTNGILLTSCSRAKLEGVVVTDCGTHGIALVDTTHCQLVGCHSYDNSKVATAGTGDGLNLSGTSTDNVVVGLVAYDSAEAGSKRQGYGIREAAASSCDRNLIMAGSLDGNLSGAYSLVGAASKSLDNTPLPVSGYAQASLPAAGTAGRLARVTDGVRGLWMDQGSQWFNLAGEVVNVKEFGAKGDGSTDDTAAIQAAINAAIVANTGVIIPAGTYKVTGTLSIANVSGFSFVGSGSSDIGYTGTILSWAGNSTDPMIDLADVAKSFFAHFTIRSSAAAPLAVGIRSHNTSATGTVTAARNLFLKVVMDGTTNSLGKGWQFAQGAGDLDANNDLNSFIECSVNNYGTAAWSFEHSQSKGHRFYGCIFAANLRGGLYGVTTALGASSQGGSFQWYGGGGGGNAGADFYLGVPNDTCIIDGPNLENSSRLLLTLGPTGARQPTVLRGVRYAHAGYLDADGYAIKFRETGPLVVEGCSIQDTPGAGTNIRILISGSSHPGILVLLGNYIETSATDVVVTEGTGKSLVYQLGNMLYNTLTGVATALPSGIGMRRLAGSVTITGTSTTAPVTFPSAEIDANYLVALAVSGTSGTPATGSTRAFVTNKATTGFTINLEVAPGTSNSVSVDWVVVR